MLVYGGPYSNLSATEALLAQAQALGIGPQNRVCTGDIVAYGAEAVEVWARIAAEGGTIVAGNCEKQLSQRADGCGCGFESGTACDLLSKGWYDHARRVLPDEALDWMGSVPDMVIFTHAGRRCAVIHGGATDISRFIWPSSDVAVFAEEIDAIRACVGPVDMVIAGHCGIAFQRLVGDVLWLNAGAIGLPPHDGCAATRYARIDGGGAIVIERLDYDPRPSQHAMERAGLVQGYDRTLSTGIWPSEDVLPDALRRAG